MNDQNARDAKTTASELVRAVSADMNVEVSEADLGIIVEAVERDMATQSQIPKDGEERLARVEAQTQVLAEAVIAIAKIEDTIAPAVRAVKDEMHVPGAVDQKPKGRTG